MMASDDEAEPVSHTISEYCFVDDKDEPISFSELPVQWSDSESLDDKKKLIFLNGKSDIQKIYKQVTAWKFDISGSKPEISVLSKEKNWITLQKPRKSFEHTVRTILITVHSLHYLEKNPGTFGKALWDHLSETFSLYEAKPSENDLVDHVNLITEAIKRNEALGKA
ncbi:hypothetical protein RJ639_010072, partial [Escallonia herrerae]